MNLTPRFFTVAGALGVLSVAASAQIVTPEEYQKVVGELRKQVATDAAIVLDAARPMEDRLKAASAIETVYEPAQIASFLELAKSNAADPQLRQAALQKVTPYLAQDREAIASLLSIAGSEDGNQGLRAAALEKLAALDFSGLRRSGLHGQYLETMRGLTQSKVASFKERAYGTLAASGDDMVLKRLRDGVLNPGEAPLDPVTCVQFLGINPRPDIIKDLEPALAKYADLNVKSALLRLLPVSSSSREKVAAYVKDAKQPDQLRIAAIEGLAAAAPERLVASVASSIATVNESPDVLTAALEKLQTVTPEKLNLNPQQTAGITEAAKGFLSKEEGADKQTKRAAWNYLKTHARGALETRSEEFLEKTRDPDLKSYFKDSLK